MCGPAAAPWPVCRGSRLCTGSREPAIQVCMGMGQRSGGQEGSQDRAHPGGLTPQHQENQLRTSQHTNTIISQSDECFEENKAKEKSWRKTVRREPFQPASQEDEGHEGTGRGPEREPAGPLGQSALRRGWEGRSKGQPGGPGYMCGGLGSSGFRSLKPPGNCLP